MNPTLNSGNILNSRYQILRLLGQGGFGRTYLAEDLNRFRELCVLKEFAPQLQDPSVTEKAQELFEREAGVLYRLQHPQIPKFRELLRYKEQDQNKEHLLLVQDYIEGQTYESLSNNPSRPEKKFSEAEIRQLLSQLLPVLEYIHSMGVVHRDISPDNIILSQTNEQAILIDFGSIKEIATKAQSQFMGEIPSTDSSLLDSTVIGKIGYAPPEQMESGIVFDHSDLYALAATAVVLLTGKQPQQLIEPYTKRWDWQKDAMVSPKLQCLLNTMLSPKPQDRFSSATEVRQILEDITGSTSGNKSYLPAQPKKISLKFFWCMSEQTSILGVKTRLIIKLLFLGFLAGTISLGFFGWRNNQANLTFVFQSISDLAHSYQIKFQLDQRFSQGEKILIPQTTTPQKKLAVAAFKQGKYEEAESLFSESLRDLPNDPESLIYLNNARIGEDKSYSIAVSIPIGTNLNPAQEILRGVAQAQNQLNQAGGIKDILLKVHIINDDNDLDIARQVARNLSHNQEILGVIGHYTNDATLATNKIYQSGQLVTISPTSTSVKISNISPYLFRTVPSDFMAARSLTQYMFEHLRKQKVVIFYNSQSKYSNSLKSEFVTGVLLGRGMVISELDLSDPNFNAAHSLQHAIDNGAGVIMLAAENKTLDKALQVIKVNRQRLSLLGGDSLYDSKTWRVAGKSAEGMVLAVPWYIQGHQDEEFTQVAKKLWRGNVNWRTAMAYDAASALISAIELHPTRNGIQEALSNPSFSAPGASSQIRFEPTGDSLQNVELIKVQPTNSNSADYEFVPVFSNN